MTNLITAWQDGDRPEFNKLLLAFIPAFVLWLVGGLALSRILYEGFFPYLLWLGYPPYTIPFVIIVALLGSDLWQRQKLSATVLLPLLINFIYLFNPTVNLVVSQLVFFASLWLIVLLIAHEKVDSHAWHWFGILMVVTALLPIYLLTMPDAVGQADTFEFQVVAPQLGIAHPTGYPLYLLLGKLFTLLPVKSVAWRLNAATMLYGLAAVSLLFTLGYRMRLNPVTAVLGATVFGLIPTFWSQAIEAEVYTLHTLFVVLAFVLMREIGDWRLGTGDWGPGYEPSGSTSLKLPIALAFVLGLGLTNHLTTVFLLPAAALTLLFASTFTRRQSIIANLKSLIILALAFLLPLLLYTYLPLRWQAIHGEPMGMARFVDWVLGGRFAGALQWRAWLNDMTRYEVIGRIFLTNWGWVNLGIALFGFVFMLRRSWRVALIFGLTWFAYTFYGLNYYVPDLDVFIIGAQVVVAVWWMTGANTLLEIRDWRLGFVSNLQSLISSLLVLLLFLPTLINSAQNWSHIDQSQDDGGQPWGEGVLALPLAENAAILADSEKIAPLYYLQQAEGVRPDLDIMVLPDEAAYRAELDSRVAAEQTVYLARFLPGLEGIYHLRSLGPLTEVSAEPLTTLPETAVSTSSSLSPIQLIGYEVEPVSPFDETQTAVTLYWQTVEPIAQPLHVYLRLGDETSSGQHPANNTYPTNAWKADEVVADFHSLPRPVLTQETKLELQVALAPPLTPSSELDWQTITAVTIPAAQYKNLSQTVRAHIGESVILSTDFPTQIRPQRPLPIQLSGYGDPSDLQIMLGDAETMDEGEISNQELFEPPFTLLKNVDTNLENGRYPLTLSHPKHLVSCGWLRNERSQCVLGEVEINGIALPETAVNYNDQIALLNLDIADKQLIPGGSLNLTLQWTGLTPLSEDYTLFLQVLDDNDRLVGQVDAWPLQGTLPTSQWQPGERITDPYTIQLDSDLPPGEYRLLIGWYLLADLRRLPILNADGQPIDDKFVMPGLFVPE
jgi:hypothetical protein